METSFSMLRSKDRFLKILYLKILLHLDIEKQTSFQLQHLAPYCVLGEPSWTVQHSLRVDS